MQPQYQKFETPQPSSDPMLGNNKSGRPWKLGLNKKPAKNYTVNKGLKLTWEEKKARALQLKQLRGRLKQFKTQKLEKRQQEKLRRKEKKKLKQMNSLKSANFEVIKDSKKIKKWSRKLKDQLVKLPAEIFEQVIKRK